MPTNIEYIWCVVKRAAVKKAPDVESVTVDHLTFGQNVILGNKPVTNGFLKISYRMNDKKKTHVTGWVSVKAMTRHEVEDFACLDFVNTTGKRIPVISSYYNGENMGYIDPGESVVVRAKVGRNALTNRGWTRFEWLTKEHYIFDQGVIDNVLYATLMWAVRDYRFAVKKILHKKYQNMREYCNLVDDVDDVGVFFMDRGNAMNIDKVPGPDRLDMLNEELGIDRSWLKEQICKRDRYRQLRGWKND